MKNSELLKNARDLLLSLHKDLVDHERALHEGIHGPATPGQFLSLLLEDSNFEWLRKFSALIVDIDEMFAQRDGYTDEAVNAHLTSIRQLLTMDVSDDTFRAKYEAALQQVPSAAAKHGSLRAMTGD